MKNLIVFFATVLMLSGCNLQQDPLDGAPPEVREGRAPDTGKLETPDAFPKEALQIDAPNVVQTRIGSQVEFKISYRLAVEGVDAKISIDNLSDFVGAQYDEKTGLFTWTPTRESVGNFPLVELPLSITLATVPSDVYPKITVETKKVTISVTNSYSRPLVQSLTGDDTVYIGNRYVYKMVIEDLDAYTRHDVTAYPRNCSSYRTDLSAFVTISNPIADLTNPGKYLVDVNLDLSSVRTREIPTGSYCFGVAAVSKYGQVSQVMTKEVSVVGSFRDTRISTDTIDVAMGGKTKVSFSVYEPSGNTTVTIDSMTNIGNILPGSSIVCKAASTDKSVQNCNGVIDATTATAEKRHVFEIEATANSVGGGGRQPRKTKHSINIFVKAGGN